MSGDRMIVKIEQDLSVKEIEILIKYPAMNKDVERIAAMLQSVNTRIRCRLAGSEKFVSASDIYYFESVEKTTFVYCEKEVYETDYRLYEVVKELMHPGFIQISKSCVLNIDVLDSVAPLLNSRMEATLQNGERLLVTRKYLENLKQALRQRV